MKAKLKISLVIGYNKNKLSRHILGVHSFTDLTMTPAWIKTGSGRVNCVALKDITQRPQQGINVLLTDLDSSTLKTIRPVYNKIVENKLLPLM